MYIITLLLAPATSKTTNRGGGKGYTLNTKELTLSNLPLFYQRSVSCLDQNKAKLTEDTKKIFDGQTGCL